MKLTMNNGQEIELDEPPLEEGELVANVVLCYETASMKDAEDEKTGYVTSRGLTAASIIGMATIARVLVEEKVKG